jgi:acetyl esterase/lipase
MNFDRENLTYTRKQMNEMFVSTPNDAVLTTERFIPGPEGEPDVRVKIYEPKVKDEILPGVFFIHGGGYIVGNQEMDDDFYQELVTDVNCVIASVAYRLAPEHPFPAPVEDCYAALKCSLKMQKDWE